MHIKSKASYCLVCLFTLTMVLAGLGYTKENDASPEVVNFDVPFYSLLARRAKIEGIVHVKVKTDGKVAVEAKAEDGNKILAKLSELNAITWKFRLHEPVSFTIKYKYKLVKNDSQKKLILRLPHEVEIHDTYSPPPISLGLSSLKK